MTESVNDIDSLKEFIRGRTQDTWKDRGIPYYLSFVATDLKKQGVNYREYTGALKLSQWASSAEIPGTKFVTDPKHKARVGFIPDGVEFNFNDNIDVVKSSLRTEHVSKRADALHQFVSSLAQLSDEEMQNFHVPANILVSLLRK